MPPGSVHTSNSIATATVLSVASAFMDAQFLSTSDCTAIVFGCLGGIILSPDLDCDDGFIGYKFLRNIPVVGRAISFAWWIYWTPYRKIAPHRSFISHAPFISTILRELVVGLPAVILAYSVGVVLEIPWRIVVMFTIGLSISDAQHWLADVMSGEFRNYN